MAYEVLPQYPSYRRFRGMSGLFRSLYCFPLKSPAISPRMSSVCYRQHLMSLRAGSSNSLGV